MNSIKKLAAFAAVATLLPLSALAHDSGGNLDLRLGLNGQAQEQTYDNDNENDNRDMGLANKLLSDFHFRNNVKGSVTAVGTSSFDLKAKNGTTFTVNVASAKLLSVFGNTIALSDIKVGDNASVKGTVDGSQVSAVAVVITPANTHRAKASGTVTAASGNTITIQSQHDGVIFPVTVKTNASTTVVSGSSTISTLASITVGAKVTVKGLWDELLNVLNAIKISIR